MPNSKINNPRDIASHPSPAGDTLRRIDCVLLSVPACPLIRPKLALALWRAMEQERCGHDYEARRVKILLVRIYSLEESLVVSFNSILCAFDFDRNSLLALRVASELTRSSKGILHIFHVVGMPPDAS